MNSIVDGVYYCNFSKAAQMNSGIYDRNLPSAPLQMSYDPRPTPTRYVKMPIVDCRIPPTVPCKTEILYNPYKTFTPGMPAPFSGFAGNIDQESRIQNRFFPLQKSAQAKFIPSSNSDMYKVKVVTSKPVKMNYPLLFKQEKFYKNTMNKLNIKLLNLNLRTLTVIQLTIAISISLLSF